MGLGRVLPVALTLHNLILWLSRSGASPVSGPFGGFRHTWGGGHQLVHFDGCSVANCKNVLTGQAKPLRSGYVVSFVRGRIGTQNCDGIPALLTFNI